ncbi:MAG TPA: lipid-A-disaccharide synthase N-terminal domain-containing protein [Candidatus Brocadiia bacterium]|nr:lipid-A-disaccharide synthase N-terminal domain-containing protein [Candidatus Brocadiia bacterium]
MLWIIIGCSGQAIFGCRFLVQWIASEKAGRSYIPVVFWHLSLAGSLLLLAYAIKRRDPVFFIGFSLNSVVYVRNLMLIEKERRKSGSPAGAGEEDAR